MNNATTAITRCTSYNFEEVNRAVRETCDNTPFPEVKDKVVLVKPNILSDAKPELCITTNPEVLRAVIRLVKEKGAREVLCGDSPGIQGQGFAGRTCGIAAVCNEEGATWVNFIEGAETAPIDGTRDKLPMARCIKTADVIIGVCKFKTHQLMYTTGAVKNYFGTIPGLNKSPCHIKHPSRESFARLIVGIHETVKPDFCVMDAVIGMEGPGPANGYPRPVNLIIASNNDYAADLAELTIMGYQPDDIPIINEAVRRHLLPPEISYPLLNPKDLVISDFKRVKVEQKTKLFSNLILPFFTRGIQKRKRQKESAPQFNPEKCIVCQRCINICPAKALSLDAQRHVVIDTQKCIRCYCCHEMCPADAITVQARGQQ